MMYLLYIIYIRTNTANISAQIMQFLHIIFVQELLSFFYISSLLFNGIITLTVVP